MFYRAKKSTDDYKELGRVTVNKHVVSIIYIVAQTCSLCSTQILANGVNPQ